MARLIRTIIAEGSKDAILDYQKHLARVLPYMLPLPAPTEVKLAAPPVGEAPITHTSVQVFAVETITD